MKVLTLARRIRRLHATSSLIKWDKKCYHGIFYVDIFCEGVRVTFTLRLRTFSGSSMLYWYNMSFLFIMSLSLLKVLRKRWGVIDKLGETPLTHFLHLLFRFSQTVTKKKKKKIIAPGMFGSVSVCLKWWVMKPPCHCLSMRSGPKSSFCMVSWFLTVFSMSHGESCKALSL